MLFEYHIARSAATIKQMLSPEGEAFAPELITDHSSLFTMTAPAAFFLSFFCSSPPPAGF